MGRYTRAISGQQFGKHIPVATDLNTTIEELCFLCGLCQDVVSTEQGVSSVEESVNRGLEPGGRGIAIVGAATRKHLVTD
jgi:hypothetical protein